jgi:hypothetical protein
MEREVAEKIRDPMLQTNSNSDRTPIGSAIRAVKPRLNPRLVALILAASLLAGLLFQREVFYPIWICIGALYLGFCSSKPETSAGICLALIGLAFVIGAIGFAWLFGLEPEKLRRALSFKGPTVTGLERPMVLPYILIFGGLLVMLRAFALRTKASGGK